MRTRNRLTKLAWVSCSLMVFASAVDAQILPRNRERVREKPQVVPPRAVERGADVRVDVDPGGVQVQPAPAVRPGVDVRANTTQSTRAGQTTNILRSTQLVGTMVSVQGDRRVGKIAEIVFNDGGCIAYVIVDVNGRMAPIPWHVGHFDVPHRTFILDNFDVTRLERIPTITRFEQFNDQGFVTQINQFYGVSADSRAGTRSGGRSVLSTETQRGARETEQFNTSTRRQDAPLPQDRAQPQDRGQPQDRAQPQDRSAQPDRDRPDTSGAASPETGSRSDAVPPPPPQEGAAGQPNASQGNASPGQAAEPPASDPRD